MNTEIYTQDTAQVITKIWIRAYNSGHSIHAITSTLYAHDLMTTFNSLAFDIP